MKNKLQFISYVRNYDVLSKLAMSPMVCMQQLTYRNKLF